MSESGRAWYCPECEVFSRIRSTVAESDGTCVNCRDAQVVEIHLGRPTVGVGVIVEHADTHLFLMGKRAGELDKAGTWQLPGGSLEHGETIEKCARREVAEEAGITDLRDFEILKTADDIRPEDGIHHIIVFCVFITNQEPKNKEPDKCDGWRWFSEGALPSPMFKPLMELLVQDHGGVIDSK
jgi:8-oxo-dGTP diphosphatase